MCAAFTSCKSLKEVQKETEMFQYKFDSTTSIVYKDLKIQPLDRLKIQLHTEATAIQEQTAIFNLPGNGDVANTIGVSTFGVSNYLVDNNGYIEYPKLGKIFVAGLTSRQLKDSLYKMLSVYIKSPRLFVQIAEVPIYAFGQLNKTGKLLFPDEKVNLYDFLSSSGGVVATGGRMNDILVVREEAKGRKYYNIDITNPTSMYQSPVFQLQQNDIVYVYSTKNKLRQLRNNDFANSLQLGTTGLNLFTTAVNMFFLIYTLSR